MTAERSQPRPRLSLHWRILFGLLVGAALGLTAKQVWTIPPVEGAAHPADADGNGVDDRLDWVAGDVAEFVGRLFLRLIFMVVVPLVVSALVLGVSGLGDVRKLGRVGVRTLLLTVVFSFSAVAVGMLLVNVLKPGGGLDAGQRDRLYAQYASGAAEQVQKARQAKSVRNTLLDLIPENPLQEMVGAVDGSSKGNGLLAVMFFSLIFGAALTTLGERAAEPVLAVLNAVFKTCMVIIGWAMRLAPYAVGCLVFSITSRFGTDVLQLLGWFIVVVLGGLLFQMVVVYPLALRFLGGVGPGTFFHRSADALVTAFGTSSSNATLPTALRVAKEKLRIPPSIAGFVLTVGATGNQNGTALYEGVVVLFLAQVFGVELTLAQQLMVMLMAVLAGVGTAGVPGGSLPLIVIVMQSVGVPGEGIAIILGVDRVLDMCRTTVNVAGDLAIAAVVSAGEPAELAAAPDAEP